MRATRKMHGRLAIAVAVFAVSGSVRASELGDRANLKQRLASIRNRALSKGGEARARASDETKVRGLIAKVAGVLGPGVGIGIAKKTLRGRHHYGLTLSASLLGGLGAYVGVEEKTFSAKTSTDQSLSRSIAATESWKSPSPYYETAAFLLGSGGDGSEGGGKGRRAGKPIYSKSRTGGVGLGVLVEDSRANLTIPLFSRRSRALRQSDRALRLVDRAEHALAKGHAAKAERLIRRAERLVL